MSTYFIEETIYPPNLQYLTQGLMKTQYIIPPPSHHSPSLSIVALAVPNQRCSWGSLSRRSYRAWRNGQSQKLAAPKSFRPTLHTGSAKRGYRNIKLNNR